MLKLKILFLLLIIPFASNALGKDKSAVTIGRKMREQTHYLDLTKPKDLRIYFAALHQYIKTLEGYSPYARNTRFQELDADGKIKIFRLRRIGYGFDMNRAGSREEWREALGNKVLFDAAITGKISITEDQAAKLLEVRIRQIDNKLSQIYSGFWHKLKGNERGMLVDINYYDSDERNIGKGTQIYNYLKEYCATSDNKFLESALAVVKNLPYEKEETSQDEYFDSLRALGSTPS